MNRWIALTVLCMSALGMRCGGGADTSSIETEYAQRNSALITCTEKENPTVIQGFEKTIALVNHHGIDLLPTTSNALNAMQQAADADGIQLELLLGFLEHPILETLFDCGPEGTCQCNACNVTPYPGYSPHQAGTAVALRVDPPEVLEWLEIHGDEYGFSKPFVGEPWSWVHDGETAIVGPCESGTESGLFQATGGLGSAGFWTLSEFGRVIPYGSVQHVGEPTTALAGATWTGIAAHPEGIGYWVVSSKGEVQGLGGIPSYGNFPFSIANGDVIGIASSPSGQGYWIGSESGAVQAFGDATELAPVIIQPSAAPVTRLRPTPDSTGFWLLREDGKLVLYNAPYHGEPAAITGKAIDLIPTANADGYWILTQTGGLLPFGAAADLGGLAGLTDTPVAAGFSGSPTGDGLWIVEESGGLTSMGTAGAIASGVTGYGFNPTPPPQFVLHVSSNPDRSDSVPLDGASIQGDVYIFVSPIGESSRGRFAFNQSPLETETPFVDDSWPLDLEGGSLLTANPFNTYSLAPGAHTLNGHIERLHGLESASVSATFTIANPVCGDGIIEGPEECDAGACCDPVFCQLIEDGTLCREAEGTCDLPEFCSGGSPFCPTDSYKPAGWVCRAAGTSCDVEEACTGASAQCPPNGVLPDGTPCEGSGECVLGYCEEPELPEEDVSEPEPEADAGEQPDGGQEDATLTETDGVTSDGAIETEEPDASSSEEDAVPGAELDGSEVTEIPQSDSVERESPLEDAPPVSNDVANGNPNSAATGLSGPAEEEPEETAPPASAETEAEESLAASSSGGCSHSPSQTGWLGLLFSLLFLSRYRENLLY